MTGTPPQKHLSKIEDDQSIQGIDTIDDTIRNDAGRKFFVSQEIGPKADMAWYNRTTGRLIPGPYGYFVPNSSWTTTSAAALTLTCAAGHRYRVYYAGARNATQATDLVLSGVIGGNAWTEFNTTNGFTFATTETIALIGTTGGQVYDGVGVIGKPGINELWLNAGDTLTMTLGTYAAGNNTEHLFMFEDYEV